jgi:hypothetical protein
MKNKQNITPSEQLEQNITPTHTIDNVIPEHSV